MEIDFLEIILLLMAGVVTGIVNTVAGSGTIFSVGTMLFVGIPIELANTTNRLGVLFQNIAGTVSFKKFGGLRHLYFPFGTAFSVLAGALIGAYLASIIETQLLEVIALVVILLMISQILLNRFNLKMSFDKSGHRFLLRYRGIVFFFLGLYGGFIQIGVGILILVALRSLHNLNWVEANYIKLIVILIYTVPTTIYFGIQHMILWIPGFVLAFGQVMGAYFSGWLFNVNHSFRNSVSLIVLGMLLLTALRIVFEGIHR